MRRTVRGHGLEHALRARHPAAGRAGGGAARRRGDHAARAIRRAIRRTSTTPTPFPSESSLEETYYHRLDPPQGFAFQRVYTDDRSLDEAMTVEDRDVVMVPRGYHPVIVPHGYTSYYLNVMAGPHRVWHFHNDPAHAWMLAPSAVSAELSRIAIAAIGRRLADLGELPDRCDSRLNLLRGRAAAPGSEPLRFLLQLRARQRVVGIAFGDSTLPDSVRPSTVSTVTLPSHRSG